MQDSDPFGNVVYSSGVTLDLTASEEELAHVFTDLLLREGTLLQRGVTCHLKDGGQDCLCCPAATLDATETRSVLCRLGKDQSTVEKAYEAQRDARLAPIMELAALASECAEIGDMPEELAVLLTEIGP
jgi:hypothetical protein